MGLYFLRTERAYREYNGNISFSLRNIDALRMLKKEHKSKWIKFYNLKSVPNINGGCAVYAIVIRNVKSGKEDIAYIGSSKSMSVRLFSHQTLNFLLFYLTKSFTIDLYLFYVENCRMVENILIKSINPFLNKMKPSSKTFNISKKFLKKLKNGTEY